MRLENRCRLILATAICSPLLIGVGCGGTSNLGGFGGLGGISKNEQLVEEIDQHFKALVQQPTG